MSDHSITSSARTSNDDGMIVANDTLGGSVIIPPRFGLISGDLGRGDRSRTSDDPDSRLVKSVLGDS